MVCVQGDSAEGVGTHCAVALGIIRLRGSVAIGISECQGVILGVVGVRSDSAQRIRNCQSIAPIIVCEVSGIASLISE